MQINIGVNIGLESFRGKENIHGQTDLVTKGSLLKGLGMDKAAGNHQKIMETST